MFNRQYVQSAEFLFNALYAINAADGPEAYDNRRAADTMGSDLTAYAAGWLTLKALTKHIIPNDLLRTHFTDKWLPDNFGDSFSATLDRFETWVNTGDYA